MSHSMGEGPGSVWPEVPVESAAPRVSYTELITRRLCAAAFARPNRAAAVRKDLRQTLAAAKQKVRHRLGLRSATDAEKGTAGGRKPPRVVLGEDFAVWVRDRIARQSHPVPVFAYELEPIERACDRAVRLTRRRRAVVILLAVGCIAGAITGTVTIGTAALSLALGCWLSFLVDRLLAQRAFNDVLQEPLADSPHTSEWSFDIPAPTAAVPTPSPALPYTREMRKDGPRDRFIGAGPHAWPPAVIGIDVEPAPEWQDDDEPPDLYAGQPSADGSAENTAAAVLAALGQQGKRGGARKPLKHFTVTELHEHVARRLREPAPSHDRQHPIPRIEVLGIAGIADHRWGKQSEKEWAGLQALAENRSLAGLPATEVARRYIWARIVSWNGEMVASVLVHFAYEGGFLRVTVRPHIMTPLNPAVADLAPTHPQTIGWLGRAAVNAVGDVAAATGRLIRRTPRPKPELDAGGPVSLREVYSVRWMDDMHMNDDARYYVQMMQRRVFDSTEIFLRDHNVDIAAYRQQATAIYNFGVMNGGTITGNVQAAPFASDTHMS